MRGQFVRIGKSSLGRGLVGAAFGSGTFWSLVRAQLVQFVVAQRRGRAGARQPRQPRRQWRAGASRGEQGSKQCGAPDFFDGLGPWACQEAAGWEKLAKNSQAGPGGGCVTEAAIGTRSLVTGVKFGQGNGFVLPGPVLGPVRAAQDRSSPPKRSSALHGAPEG